MSKISLAHDEIYTMLAAQFPTHKELINPAFPELDDDISYSAAYGVTFDEGANTRRHLDSCNITITRTVTFTLTRKIMAGTIRNTAWFNDKRAKEKALLEDELTLIRAIKENAFLAENAATNKMTFENDGGIEFVQTDRVDLIMVRPTFSIEFFEDN